MDNWVRMLKIKFYKYFKLTFCICITISQLFSIQFNLKVNKSLKSDHSYVFKFC